MALKTPPAPVRAVLLLALTVVLASCGGGSTAEPVAATTAATTAPPPPAKAPARTSTTHPPAPTATTPAPARARPRGGAAPGDDDDGSDPPASVADEPADTASGPEPEPEPAAAVPSGSPLDERAELVLTRRVSPAHYFQQGTVTGTYDGTMEAEARITSRGVLVSFTATLPGGTISGRALAIAILDSVRWPALRGTAIVTGGTGRFAGVHGRRLRVSGRARPDASQARVRLTGTVDY